MTDTPRTAAASWVEQNREHVVVHASFAEKLERENAKLRQALEAMPVEYNSAFYYYRKRILEETAK